MANKFMGLVSSVTALLRAYSIQIIGVQLLIILAMAFFSGG